MQALNTHLTKKQGSDPLCAECQIFHVFNFFFFSSTYFKFLLRAFNDRKVEVFLRYLEEVGFSP